MIDLGEQKEVTLEELVELTKNFLDLTLKLYDEGKITKEEYNELTFIKKDFLNKVGQGDI